MIAGFRFPNKTYLESFIFILKYKIFTLNSLDILVRFVTLLWLIKVIYGIWGSELSIVELWEQNTTVQAQTLSNDEEIVPTNNEVINNTNSNKDVSKEINEQEMSNQEREKIIEREKIAEQDKKVREYRLKRDQQMLNELIKHEDKNFEALVEKSKQNNEPLDSRILNLRAQFDKLVVREMQETASKLEALESLDSNSIERKRSASLLLPSKNGKK